MSERLMKAVRISNGLYGEFCRGRPMVRLLQTETTPSQTIVGRFLGLWSYHPVRDALYSTAAFPEQMDFRIRANNETSPK